MALPLTKYEREYIKNNSGVETIVKEFGLYQILRVKKDLHLIFTGDVKGFAVQPNETSVLSNGVGARWKAIDKDEPQT